MREDDDPEGPRACNALPVAVRVFTQRAGVQEREDRKWEPSNRARRKRTYPYEALVFDTETTIDPAQRLQVGIWRFYRDPPEGVPGTTCIEEGLFYPDDLEAWDPEGFQVLNDYARGAEVDIAPGFSRRGSGRRLELRPLSWWLEQRLFLYAYKHRNRCDLVGFNLPFDLGRIASHWRAARKYYRGGYSLDIWGEHDEEGEWQDLRYHPRLLYKAIDPRRTLFAWGGLKKEDRDDWGHQARFVDLRTLVFALTDRSYTLVQACRAFGDEWDKEDPGYGVITPELLDYAREDAAHTGTLYRNGLAELRRHEGVNLQASKLYSPASIGTSYLEAMGLAKPMEKFALAPGIYGWAMSAFFGGRAEARIVRTEVPVTLVDATSMYPSVNALLDTWRLLTAASIEEAEVTEQVRGLLADPRLQDRCYEKAFWRDQIGVTLVEVSDLADQILPVRGLYDPSSADAGIGVNPLTYEGTLWYMLPDVIASVLLSGKAPPVTRAIRLLPGPRQRGLKKVRLRGGEWIDPKKHDPFVAMIHERRRVLAEVEDAEERKRLDIFLKITANATSYGVLARFDRRELADEIGVLAYGPDDEPTSARTHNPEDPGPYCFPPIAASLTAGARLMLAMLERAVTDSGGAYAFCDTDSMAIVASADPSPVSCRTSGGNKLTPLSPEQVTAILARFSDLNPYSKERVPDLWKVEHDSLHRPLFCYAISAKRYVLFRKRGDGRELVRVLDAPEEAGSDIAETEEAEDAGITDWSEHGIGLYLDPGDPDKPRRGANGQRLWTREAWEWILASLEGDPEPAEWFDAYALTRFTVSSPRLEGWFAGLNREAPPEMRIRPGCFGLLAHPFGHGVQDPESESGPAAPYEGDPKKWPRLSWFDRHDGAPIQVHTLDPGGDPEGFSRALVTGAIRVQTLGEVVATYASHPENKSLAPDGSAATGETKGLLRRRAVHSAPILTDLIGKEGNRILERMSGEVTVASEYQENFGSRADRWGLLVVPVLRLMTAAVVADRTGRSRSAVERALRPQGATKPHASSASLYTGAAAEWASPLLSGVGVEPARHPLGTLYCYWKRVGAKAIVCGCGCGLELPAGRRKWISESHRKRAARQTSR